MYCTAETHSSLGNSQLSVDALQWLANNIKGVHKNATHGSGGVGILLGDCIAKQFDLSVIDNNADGILGVRFVDIVSD